MAVFATEGIILKRSNYGEADRVLTVFTPYKGKIRVVAKGVRRIKSRRAGNVELLNRVKLHLYQGMGAPVLTEADSIETYAILKENLTLSSYASHVAEITDRLLPEDQPNPGVYQLFAAILGILEKNPRQIFIRAYEVKLLTELGFWSTSQIQTSREMTELLTRLQMSTWDQIAEIEIDQAQAVELERILRFYIERLLESPLKSVEVIQQIKRESNS
jgi:DNA repair protein RecO (recombination protein O)